MDTTTRRAATPATVGLGEKWDARHSRQAGYGRVRCGTEEKGKTHRPAQLDGSLSVQVETYRTTSPDRTPVTPPRRHCNHPSTGVPGLACLTKEL